MTSLEIEECIKNNDLLLATELLAALGNITQNYLIKEKAIVLTRNLNSADQAFSSGQIDFSEREKRYTQVSIAVQRYKKELLDKTS